MAEQRRVTYAGHVQGVGFRYTTQNLASGYDVLGYVKNLTDGRVELVVEGTTDELNAFLTDIRRTFDSQIREENSDTRAPSGQFTSFSIRH